MDADDTLLVTASGYRPAEARAMIASTTSVLASA
jgi:hypothetical protein